MKIPFLVAMLLAGALAAAQAPVTPPVAAPPQPVTDPAAAARVKADRSSKHDCTKACFEAAVQIVDGANYQFNAGNVELGHRWMKDAVAYSRRGAQASIETHKRQKEVEITLRKLSKRIHDIGDSLSLDDRPPVYDDAKAVDALRDEVLNAMFDNPKKTLEQEKKR